MHARKLLTAADLAALPGDVPSGTVLFELEDGELIPRGPNRYDQAATQARLTFALHRHGEERGFGTALGSVAVVLGRDPDTVLVPHAAFLGQLPPHASPEGFLISPPALAAECLTCYSPSEGVTERVARYLAAGVELVWVADPDAQTVTAHRPNQPPRVSAAADALTADPVIPGFAVPVAGLFRP